MSRIRSLLRHLTLETLRRISSDRTKRFSELRYWRATKAREGGLRNEHYEQYYTTHFGLSRDDYADQRVLDIGCGPRGSLEWADMALERVGLDPLAGEYLRLGAAQHKMTYVESGSESIPFGDGHFDVVCCFNSLDHVSDLEQTISEICRVTRPGGLLLLLTDVNHAPTAAEPIEFSWDILRRFDACFEVEDERHFEKCADGLYESLSEGVAYDHADPRRRYGILSARLRRRGG